MNYCCPAVIADGPPLFIKTSFSPLDYSGSPRSFGLNGFADYKKDVSETMVSIFIWDVTDVG
jgi:hypothetical protein